MTRDAPDHGVAGRTVVVTGGAGFVGGHLAAALVGDNEVRVVDDLSTGARANVPDGARLVEGDVRDADAVAAALAGADLVFHEAGLADVARSVEEPTRCHAVNATATVELLDCARREDARVVLASSSAVYGHPESTPVAETDPTTPTSPYGVAKLAADHYARIYHDLYGLDAIPLRYFNVYGPGQSAGDGGGVVGVFLDQARRGDPITVHGDGTQTRDFVHVRDVVRANLRAATTDRVGRAFNVGTGTAVTVRELAETARDVVDSESEVVHTDARRGDVAASVADVSRAAAELGFEAATDLRTGLASLVASDGSG